MAYAYNPIHSGRRDHDDLVRNQPYQKHLETLISPKKMLVWWVSPQHPRYGGSKIGPE
jgi:hypothetical protein